MTHHEMTDKYIAKTLLRYYSFIDSNEFAQVTRPYISSSALSVCERTLDRIYEWLARKT